MIASATIEWVVLGGALLLVAHQIYEDIRAWPAFKAYTDSVQRRATMRAWTIDLVWRYGLCGLIALYLLDRLPVLAGLPTDLALARNEWLGAIGISPDLFASIGVWLAVLLAVVTIFLGVAPLFLSGKDKIDVRSIGDAAPLLPRNRPELSWGGAISFAAGVGEEVFFRLALPLAFYAVSGEFLLSFVIATIVFGAAHAYQGVAGAIMALIVGGLLAIVFLATGQIWIAIGLHVLTDLRGLVLAPVALGAHRIPA